MQKRNLLIVLLVFLLAVFQTPSARSIDEIIDDIKALFTTDSALEEMDKVTVDRVIDGDTFVLESGKKVRMIGIDAPEVKGPYTEAEFYGEQASAYTKSSLTGETVYLDKDVSNTDKYDRLLRYVYLEDGTFFNLVLIEDGYAESIQYPPDIRYTDIFESAEEKAQDSKKGLWNN